MKHFLHTEPAYTKYRTVRRKTLRLKVILYDINEIWSIDLAYADKLADYNKQIKYPIIAVDCMSRYLRVQPLKLPQLRKHSDKRLKQNSLKKSGCVNAQSSRVHSNFYVTKRASKHTHHRVKKIPLSPRGTFDH